MKKLVFFPSDPIKAYLDKGFTYDYLDGYYNPGGYFDEVYCLSPWGEKSLEKIGNIHYIKANPLRFSKIIKKINPDVVRGYGGYCCADWVSYNKVKNIPTVVSVHDTNPDLIHDSLKYADEIICMSKAVRDAVINKVSGINIDRVFVMPNRIDLSLFKKTMDEKFFSRLDEKYGRCKHILHVGRKAQQKNIDTVVKALKNVNYDANCIFIGRGDVDKYKKIAEENGVIDRCFFVDSVSHDELPLWYSWCDCMCTPSRWEGFGFVFMEAASCEACVVTSNIGPMNEYMTNNDTAILVDDYENPEAIAKAINRVLENDTEIKKIKKKARSVGMKFSKEIVDAQEIELYEMAINRGANNKNNYWLKMNQLLKWSFFQI